VILKSKTDNGCQSPQSVAYGIRHGGIHASVPGWHPWDDEIHVFGHASIAEVDFAKKRPSFEEQVIATFLGQCPDESRQVKVLLDSERLHAFGIGHLTTKVSEKLKIWERRQLRHR
jgi:hypothetical protein